MNPDDRRHWAMCLGLVRDDFSTNGRPILTLVERRTLERRGLMEPSADASCGFQLTPLGKEALERWLTA